jgi:hypothetical protein
MRLGGSPVPDILSERVLSGTFSSKQLEVGSLASTLGNGRLDSYNTSPTSGVGAIPFLAADHQLGLHIRQKSMLRYYP